ncbi:hypothetical protein [Bradyrhizobium oligotrophicum]|uniref:hypothetical protein n=1 Tax=Bradyrhizobium oligotrophicum TaxID=44255 RepID=UPI003EBD034F
MSIADLKARMADVPGIETLTMGFESGRIVLRWGAYAASVDASASDQAIEAAVRDAIKLPPVTMIPDKPGLSAVPVQSAPQPASTTGNAAQSVKALMDEHVRMMGEIQAAHVERLRATLSRQRDAMSAVGAVADKFDAQTDDFLAMMGQYTNALGEAS